MSRRTCRTTRTPKYEHPAITRHSSLPVAHRRQRRNRRLAPLRQLGYEAVPIAAVDRADELDRPPLARLARALEQERGRVERHCEQLRLIVVRHRRLDGLEARRD